MKQEPRVHQSPLTGRWYVVTRYRLLNRTTVEALEKFDVTEQLEKLGLIRKRRQRKPTPAPQPGGTREE